MIDGVIDQLVAVVDLPAEPALVEIDDRAGEGRLEAGQDRVVEAAAAGGRERVVGVDRRVVEGDDLALRPLEFAQERLLVDPAGEPAHGLEVDAGQIGDPLRHPLDRRGVAGPRSQSAR